MFGIGMPEMILIFALALIVLGPKKLPELAKSLGRAMGEFKKAASDIKDSMDMDDSLDDVKGALKDVNDSVQNVLEEESGGDIVFEEKAGEAEEKKEKNE